jgi:hypothetical protein
VAPTPTQLQRVRRMGQAYLRTMNRPFRFRDALTVSALVLVSLAFHPAREAHQFSVPAPAVWFTRLANAKPEPGPQPPSGEDPIPPYPGLDDPATVRSWSESGSGRDWRPPACTGWTAVGFTTLVTTAARFHHDSGVDGMLRRVGAILRTRGRALLVHHAQALPRDAVRA